MTRGIVAINNKTTKAETATANSAGGLCLSSPQHSKAASGTPRGIRNNNPLNIRISKSTWKGKGTPPSPLGKGEIEKDPEFEQFISMEYGFRAAILTMETYIIQHGCNTIRTIINRWAPESDGNHTNNYIQRVCQATGIGGNEPLSNHDPRLKSIVAAMAQVECGNEILAYKESLDKAFDDFTPKCVYVDTSPRRYK